MKLLHKTNIMYLIFSAILLLVFGVSLYIILTGIIKEEVTEKLIVNKKRVVKQIEYGETVTSLYPVLEVEEIHLPAKEELITKDTIIFDPFENENEPFLEVTSIENINGKIYRITVRQVIVESHDYYNTIGISLAIALIILLIGLLLINRFVSKRLWQPFYNNLDNLKNFSLQNNEQVEFQSSNIQEFEELKKTLKKLTDKVLSDYKTLKEFSENASHEIQTPLTIIQTKLEEVLQFPDISKDQAAKIRSAYLSAKRLSRLNQTLLLLTKIENHQFTSLENIQISRKIEQELEHFDDLILSKNIKVEKHINHNISIQSSPELTDILISNLLSNAIKHNLENGKIKIELISDSFTISNTGQMTEIQPDKIFNRFRKGKHSPESLGLGLAIVKKICETYGWQISYTTSNDWHTFTVKF